MKGLTLVKLGGSLITDKSRPFTERMDVIRRLAGEIASARGEREISLVIGHGGGSYPHKPARDYRVHEGFKGPESWKGFSLVQDAAATLNRIITRAIIDAGEHAISVQPSACCIAEGKRIKEWYTTPIKKILESGILPVVYGDVGIDLKQGMCILSTEEILAFLARKLKGKRLIMCGKVDGVIVRGKVIPEITRGSYPEIRKHLAGSDGIDVTGGMAHKIEQSLELAKNGIEVEIINGEKQNFLKRALLGESGLGTIIR
jgi:isopentenyl phosphate kinase